MKPILYSYYRSSCSYRVRIALNLKKIAYEYFPVHLVKNGGEQNLPDYLKLNPKGEVPFFVNGETKIAQSMAIIDYIDSQFKGINLFPSKPNDRALCIELCEIVNSGIQPIQNLKVTSAIANFYKVDEVGKKEWTKFWIAEGFNALEIKLQSCAGKFCIGDKVTAADCFLVPQVYNAIRFEIDMNDYPIIKKINANCLSMEDFKQAGPEAQPDCPPNH